MSPDAAADGTSDVTADVGSPDGRARSVDLVADTKEHGTADRFRSDVRMGNPCGQLDESACAAHSGCLPVEGQRFDPIECRLFAETEYLGCTPGYLPDGELPWNVTWVRHPTNGWFYRVQFVSPPPEWQRVSQPSCPPDGGSHSTD